MRIENRLAEVAASYPNGLRDAAFQEIPRIAFNIVLAINWADSRGLTVCDIGGGYGLFSTGCAALGMNSWLVDDFGDAVTARVGDDAFAAHRKYGVRWLSRDVVKDGLAGISERFDIVTSFDSMEHWHGSPKALFRDIVSRLKPGGRFVLGVPNCVNLRKRLSVPLGIGKWSSMQEWYEESPFRGHVREPDVSDLRYIARDMGLVDVRVIGRNWAGFVSRFAVVRLGTRIADIPLRLVPTLCSDIYLIGHKVL